MIPCHECVHCVPSPLTAARGCVRTFDDAGVTRRIFAPVEHVHRFYCQGTAFVSRVITVKERK